ncbi:MAG: hypothetical protein AVO33_01185 [delta proteobacterium ML8_F1]|nr:MAG: hypothetical protein AVO33_01185 [delta proteobacterium ML8_F1]
MKLSRRLEKIAAYVPRGSRVVDIGSDHGYLAMKLIETHGALHVVATDVTRGPVEKLQRNIAARGLGAVIEVIQTDGLKQVTGTVEVVVIAGMGGLLIRDIIRDSLQRAQRSRRMILQPMSQSEPLRRFLHQTGFRICHEAVVFEENKFYEIIVVEKGSQHFERAFDYEISPILRRELDGDARAYLRYRRNLLEKIAGNIEQKGADHEKLKVLRDRIRCYEEAIDHENQHPEGH